MIDYLNVEAKKIMANITENLPDDWFSINEINGTVKKVGIMGRSERIHIFHHAPTVVIISGKKDATSPLPDCCHLSSKWVQQSYFSLISVTPLTSIVLGSFGFGK